MSEPNDTAQEGFDQLKRNLEVRYPEDMATLLPSSTAPAIRAARAVP